MPVESYHSQASFASPLAFSCALPWNAISYAGQRIHFSIVYHNTDWSRGWPKDLVGSRMPRISRAPTPMSGNVICLPESGCACYPSLWWKSDVRRRTLISINSSGLIGDIERPVGGIADVRTSQTGEDHVSASFGMLDFFVRVGSFCTNSIFTR